MVEGSDGIEAMVAIVVSVPASDEPTAADAARVAPSELPPIAPALARAGASVAPAVATIETAVAMTAMVLRVLDKANSFQFGGRGK